MPTIQELKNFPANRMIMEGGLVATCTEVGPRKTGNKKNGDPWSLQPLSLRDNTGEIKAIIWDKPDLAEVKGRTVRIGALSTDKGWQGCMITDNEYQGKTYKQIKAQGNFLLEEYEPPKPKTLERELAAQGVASRAAPVPSAEPDKGNAEPGKMLNEWPAPPTVPNWKEYEAVVLVAHRLTRRLEPDVQQESGAWTDRSRARLSLVSTIMIAYGKKDFIYDKSDDDIPF